MPAHLLYGDSFLVSGAMTQLQEQVGPREVLEANSHRVSAGQVGSAQLRTLCGALPFLAEHRLVVVEGLLSIFDSRGPRRRPPRSAAGPGPSTAAAPGHTGDWEDLPRYIEEEMPPTTLLVFLEAGVSRGNPMLEKLRPVVQVQDLSAPTGEGLSRWIRNQATKKQAQITPGAIRRLSELVGDNLWTIENELEKLSLYVGDRAIEDGDVRLLVSEAREASIFGAVDALLEGRSAVALRLLRRLRDDGAEFGYILSMITRQLRLATLAKELIDSGLRQNDVGARLGVNREFALKRTIGQARGHSWAGLEWLYRRLLEADLAVKKGRLDQDVALELLVSDASKAPHSSPIQR